MCSHFNSVGLAFPRPLWSSASFTPWTPGRLSSLRLSYLPSVCLAVSRQERETHAARAKSQAYSFRNTRSMMSCGNSVKCKGPSPSSSESESTAPLFSSLFLAIVLRLNSFSTAAFFCALSTRCADFINLEPASTCRSPPIVDIARAAAMTSSKTISFANLSDWFHQQSSSTASSDMATATSVGWPRAIAAPIRSREYNSTSTKTSESGAHPPNS